MNILFRPTLLFLVPLVLSFIGGCQATCFQTRDELAGAVNDYLQDNSPDTEVSKTYGWPIGTWCVAEVTDFSEIFMNSTDFNEDISQWDTSRATTMRSMFSMAKSFNQPLSSWNVASVQDMRFMFLGALAFNQDLSAWEVSNVMSIESMFFGATAFNGDVSKWNVENCMDMSGLFFGAKSFNQDLSKWRISDQTKMNVMFLDASSFNQDLCSWGKNILKQTGETIFSGTSCPLQGDPDWTNPSSGPFCFECPSQRVSQETEPAHFLLSYSLFGSLVFLLVCYLRGNNGIDPSDDSMGEFKLLQDINDEIHVV